MAFVKSRMQTSEYSDEPVSQRIVKISAEWKKLSAAERKVCRGPSGIASLTRPSRTLLTTDYFLLFSPSPSKTSTLPTWRDTTRRRRRSRLLQRPRGIDASGCWERSLWRGQGISVLSLPSTGCHVWLKLRFPTCTTTVPELWLCSLPVWWLFCLRDASQDCPGHVARVECVKTLSRKVGSPGVVVSGREEYPPVQPTKQSSSFVHDAFIQPFIVVSTTHFQANLRIQTPNHAPT